MQPSQGVKGEDPLGIGETRRWILRAATEGDTEGLLALHLRVFGKALRPEYRAWKLAPRGPARSVWVAEQDGQLISQYAGIPVRFRQAGTETWAMVSVDTMTDPSHQRQGLLTTLGARAYAHWAESGIQSVIGLPNQQWGSRTAALGWAPVGELRWWVRWLDPLALVASRFGVRRPRRAPGPNGSELEPPPSTVRELRDLSPLDGLWRRLATEGLVRDATWYRWRYREAIPAWQVLGAWEGTTLGGVATVCLDANETLPTARIGEVVATDHRMRRTLLRGCLTWARAQGAVRAATLIQSRTPLEAAALSFGFQPRKSSFQVMGVDLGGGLPLGAGFQGGDFDVV